MATTIAMRSAGPGPVPVLDRSHFVQRFEVWSRGEAAQLLRRALEQTWVPGLVTNREHLARILAHPAFAAGWLQAYQMMTRIPPLERDPLLPGGPSLAQVPCAGSGPMNLGSVYPTYRDCSRPDVSQVNSLPWV